MKHSMKPFLLDALLSWAKACGYTPILVVTQHPDNTLPPNLQEYDQVAFNVGDKAVMHRKITTQGIGFSTFLLHNTHLNEVFLSLKGWKVLRIKETGEVFDLRFEEQISQQVNANNGKTTSFPSGIVLHKPALDKTDPLNRAGFATAGQTLEEDLRILEAELSQNPKEKKKAPFLKLVVNNDK